MYFTAVGIFLPSMTNVCMCRYMGYVVVYACMCMYVYVCDPYLHVLHVLDHRGTETTTTCPKHLLVTPHPAGPTQGTPGHVPVHFIPPSLSPPDTRFCAPPSRSMRPGPHWTSSGTAGERPVPAAPASILSHALSQPIWDGSAPTPGRAWPQPSLKDPSRP